MARLRQAPARLASAPGRLGGMAQPVRPLTNPLRHLYSTKRWADTRREIKRRDLYTCQWPGCGKVGGSKGADGRLVLVVDHIEPHRGDERLFWLHANLQTLCKSPCHDRHKQALEAQTRHLGAYG